MGYRPAWTSISMVIIGVISGSAVASAIPLPGPHRNTPKLKNQESPTGGDKEISAQQRGSDSPYPLCTPERYRECPAYTALP